MFLLNYFEIIGTVAFSDHPDGPGNLQNLCQDELKSKTILNFRQHHRGAAGRVD